MHPTLKNHCSGVVVVPIKSKKLGKEINMMHLAYFEPCEAFETPQPEPTPTKDIELRLECLKLAIQSNQGVWQNPETVTTDAQHYYDWITKNHNQ